MRVVEFDDGFGLALEEASGFLAGLGIGIRTDLGADDFDGHLLLDAWVFGQVDVAHAAATEQAQDTIAMDLLSFQ